MAQIIYDNGTVVKIAGIGVNPNEIEGDLSEGKQPWKKTATLRFLRSELLYDINNVAYVLGDVKPDDEQHSKHQLQDITQSGNIDRVTRIMDIAIAECVEILYPYTKADVADTVVIDDKLKETQCYDINMTLPDNFSKTTQVLLVRYIHEFVVARVLMDWLLIVAPANNDYENWSAKCMSAKESIEKMMNRRTGRARRPTRPF